MSDAIAVSTGERAPVATSLSVVARQTGVTFLSTLAIQATTFAILALAAFVMPKEAFARLSLIVAMVMLANALFELGLNVTSTKMYGDTRDEGYLRAALAVRLACLPAGAVLGLAVWWAGAADAGLGIALGAVLNLWNGMRATDQARQDYRSFARSSLIFAVLRAMSGLAALYLTRNPAWVCGDRHLRVARRCGGGVAFHPAGGGRLRRSGAASAQTCSGTPHMYISTQ